MKTKFLLSIALLCVAMDVSQARADGYTFKPSDWDTTGDANRTNGTITANDGNGTLTVASSAMKSPNDGKNVCLKYDGSTSGNVSMATSAVALVVTATNLSTNASDHSLWWLNNKNNNGSYSPATVTVADGKVTLTWNLAGLPREAFRATTIGPWTLSGTGGSTLFGLTAADKTQDVVFSDIHFELAKSDDTYAFTAFDWAYTGDAGRVAQSNISVDAGNNAIIWKGGSGLNGDGKNVCLKYGSTSTYNFATNALRLIITGTNLSTTASNHSLWYLNGYNKNTVIAPTTVTEADGKVTLTWELTKVDNTTRGNTLGAWTASNSNNGTLFGLTPATASSDVVISDIRYEVAGEYTFNASDWAYTCDDKRLTQDKISVSNNVITVSAPSGNNNVALSFKGVNEYLFARSLKSIKITGTNLSSTAANHAFWWINGTNHGGSITAASVTETDGKQTLTWDITAIAENMRNTILGEWYLKTPTGCGTSHGTIFGLTPATNGSDVTITNIEMEIVDAADIHTREIASGQFGTICLPKSALADGATVYSATDFADGTMYFAALGASEPLTAGKPYLFKATKANPTFTMSGEAVNDPVSTTYMVGTFTDTTAPVGSYVVSGTNLYKVDSNVSVGANRAYFDVSGKNNARIAMAFTDDEASAVQSVAVSQQPTNRVFDLQGRRVAQPTRPGLYIINGKKIIIK